MTGAHGRVCGTVSPGLSRKVDYHYITNKQTSQFVWGVRRNHRVGGCEGARGQTQPQLDIELRTTKWVHTTVCLPESELVRNWPPHLDWLERLGAIFHDCPQLFCPVNPWIAINEVCPLLYPSLEYLLWRPRRTSLEVWYSRLPLLSGQAGLTHTHKTTWICPLRLPTPSVWQFLFCP